MSEARTLPANTFIATGEAVSHMGATPVFVDVDEETALMDPDALAEVCEEGSVHRH